VRRAWLSDGGGYDLFREMPENALADQEALVPAPTAVKAAAADQKHDNNDNEKGGGIHLNVSRWCSLK